MAYLDRGTVLVVGGPGSGKTSLTGYLVAQLDRALPRVAHLDADPGQPSVGLPGCLGLALTRPWRSPEAQWFVGDGKAASRPLPSLVGTLRLAERARQKGAAVVVVDPGVDPARHAGRRFLVQLATALGADQVVALQEVSSSNGHSSNGNSSNGNGSNGNGSNGNGSRGNGSSGSGGDGESVHKPSGLDLVLELLADRGLTVHRVEPSASALAAARANGREEERRDAAERRLKAHLADTRVRLFRTDRLLDATGSPALGLRPPPGTVVGLLGADGLCVGLGLVEESRETALKVLCPKGIEVPVSRVQVGTLACARVEAETEDSPLGDRWELVAGL